MMHGGVKQSDQAYLPQNQSATLGAQNQDITILAPRNSNAADTLRKWNNGLLVTLFAAVHVHHSFVSLGRENMRGADSQTVGRGRALLESRSQYGRRLQFVDADPYISERGCWRFGG